MNIQNNVVSFANATNATFPELNKTGFVAAFETIHQPNGVEIPKHLGRSVIRTDNKTPLGIVGKNYGIAQNNDLRNQIIESAEKSLPRHFLQDIQLNEKTSGGGAFTRFEFTFPKAAADIRQTLSAAGHTNSTTLNFKISVINSFNGSTNAIVKCGVVDLVCTNGMVASVYDTSKKRHSGNFNSEFFADFLETNAREYLERVRIWQQWAERSINAEQAETLLKAGGLSERLTKKFMEQLDHEFSKRGKNLWALASAATFYSSHESPLFPVRNSANADNVAFELNKREQTVSNLFASDAWNQFAGVAA